MRQARSSVAKVGLLEVGDELVAGGLSAQRQAQGL